MIDPHPTPLRPRVVPAPKTVLSAAPSEIPAVHTLDEAAEILRVRGSWLERQAAARKIPFTMLGGAYHFTAEHLAAIVRQHEITPAERAQPASDATRSRRPARSSDRPTAYPSVEPLRARPRTGPRRAA
jgi:hypothetical protein